MRPLPKEVRFLAGFGAIRGWVVLFVDVPCLVVSLEVLLCDLTYFSIRMLALPTGEYTPDCFRFLSKKLLKFPLQHRCACGPFRVDRHAGLARKLRVDMTANRR